MSVVDPGGIYLAAVPSGTVHNGLASYDGGSVRTKDLGSGTPIPLKPRCFAVYVWLRKA